MNGKKEYKDVVYLIDFGLSKRYRNPKTGQHVKYINHRRLSGTARYASIHALEGYETSRRDDLEGLSYVLVYFLNGHLPWERIKNKNKQERYKLILNMKKKINEENLVGDKNNKEFIEFVKYCRRLKFEENPDYNYLRGLMINCINKSNKTFDVFSNIPLNKNQINQINQRNKSSLQHFKNISQNISCKNTRDTSIKLIKTHKKNKIIISKNNVNKDTKEQNDFDNKIINESKSSSLGYIDKKIQNYSNFNNHGIKEIQLIIEYKQKQLNKSNNIDNILIDNYLMDKNISHEVINKNKTGFKVQDDNNENNIKYPLYEKKKNKRTRFYFIKRGLGIETKEDFTNDPNKMIALPKNISNVEEKEKDKEKGEEENHHIIIKEEACIII
jgi:hypothetical protein